MKLKQKCNRAEADLQKMALKIIKYKQAMQGAVVVANPFSELQLHYGSERAKNVALQKARAMGWQKGQPDLLILHPKNGYAGLALELKTQKADPFRKMRTGGLWLEESKAAQANHVWVQAAYLARLQRAGFYSCFAAGEPQILDILNQWCTGNLRKEEYHFSYSWEAENVIYRV